MSLSEQLYEDFTTKLLPQIQEGLTITKDYFVDLFGRYIQYLLITDILNLCLAIITVMVAAKVLHWIWKNRESMQDRWGSLDIGPAMLGCVMVIMGLAAVVGIFSVSSDIVKLLYVPEIRIYEEIKNFNTQ